jgi:hypothetical protein
MGNEGLSAAYRNVMHFPANGFQSKVMGRFLYLTSSNSSILFVF